VLPVGKRPRGGAGRVAAALACALVLLAACTPAAGIGRLATSGATSATSSEPPFSIAPSVQRPELGLARTALPGPAYDLTYDATRDSLWFAQMSLGGPSTLFEYRHKVEALNSWPLPQADYNGFVTRVRVAPDGAVWLNQLYSIVRFDPTNGTYRVLHLAQEDADAVASALSPDSRSPGTWPAAIAIDASGTVLVSRHNVASLLEVSTGVTASGRISLPAGVVGPSDIADVADNVYWVTPNGIGTVSGTGAAAGRALSGIGASRLTYAGQRLLAIGPESIQVLSPSGAAALPSTAGSPSDLAVATPEGAYVWRRESALIQKIDGSGSATAVLQFATFPAEGPQPNGATETALDSGTITAMAIDATGSLWCIEVDGGAAYLVHFSL